MQLVLRIWGTEIRPTKLTATTGVAPSRSFEVGEAIGPAARRVAGWEWQSAKGSDDLEPLTEELLHALGAHAALFGDLARGGASVRLTAVGEVLGELIATEEEADAADWDSGGAFPSVASRRPVIFLDQAIIEFLSTAGATFEAHLDFDIEGSTTR